MSIGNHEYISGIDAVERFVDKTEITLLRDSVARIGEIASWWYLSCGQSKRKTKEKRENKETIGSRER